MKKSIFTFLRLLVYLLLPLALFPQQMDLHRSIQWLPDLTYKSVSGQDISLLNFKGASNMESAGNLPVFEERLALNDANVIPHLTFSAIRIEALDPGTVAANDDFLNVSPEFVANSKVIIDGKKPYLILSIIPFRSNKESGQIEKLLEFECKISLEKMSAEEISVVPEKTYAEHSVLKSGDWYRISVDSTGIQRLDYNDLVNMGIDPTGIDPRNIRIYGNVNGMLKESNSAPSPDDLTESAIKVSGEEDGHFDLDDYILFYGQGAVVWRFNNFFQRFEHELNLYTDSTYYFLTIGTAPGKRISSLMPATGDITDTLTDFTDYRYHEQDNFNLIKSGKKWYGEKFSSQLSQDFDFTFPTIDKNFPVSIKINVVARSTENSHFKVFVYGNQILEQQIGSVTVDGSTYGREYSMDFISVEPKSELFPITISYDKPNTSSAGWLNYIELNAMSRLEFSGGQLSFRNSHTVGAGRISEFNIKTSLTSATIWDISSALNPVKLESIPIPDGLAIKVPTDTLKEFIIFDGTKYFRPGFVEKVDNQDLHATASLDMVIITNPLFKSEAERLAEFHRQNDGLTVMVTTPQKIYNEFSAGAQDISAIRNFLKMIYKRGNAMSTLRYLLLFGDASYDYKYRLDNNSNLVPTFESQASLNYSTSFPTDDFFGCFDIGEGSDGIGTADIGIGRLPVQTAEEAKSMVDKIIHYEKPPKESYGPWRNSIFFVADEGNDNIHLDQAEDLSSMVNVSSPVYNLDKIYLDAYTRLNTPSGYRYPEVNTAIDNAVRNGALIVNYTGHGGEVGWANTLVLDMPTIKAWKNFDHMPVFVTATCEFSRFDDPSLVSAGELVILNGNGGGICLLTTTRQAFSQANFGLNIKFYNAVFKRDSLTGEYNRLGDLIRLAKTPSNASVKNFVLLGDPAVMMAYPKDNVKTISVTNDYSGTHDTISALSKVTVKGQIEDVFGNKINNFNGLVYPVIYDKPVLYKTRANASGSRVQNFYIQNKELYKGIVTVSQGEFTFSFIVPKDISYEFGDGKISYYAIDTVNYTDANGYHYLPIGGSDSYALFDIQGPKIDLHLNSLSFNSGDLTTNNPLMIIGLSDTSGINTVGNGIGHDITAVIDDNNNNTIILNDYFIPKKDNYQAGDIQYRIGPFVNGVHTLRVKAWDMYNNSSESTVKFIVNSGAPLTLQEVYNKPNPFSSGTYFVFSHNKPGAEFNVIIDIYNLNGQFIRSISSHFTTESLLSEPIYWDGKDEGGNTLSSGLYIYQIKVNTQDGFYFTRTQKLMIIK